MRWVQASLANSERRTRNRLAEAQRLEKKIGTAATEDFTAPAPAVFVKGNGHVVFTEFTTGHARRRTVIMHVQTRGAGGGRVDVCLFGSMDGLCGFSRHDTFHDGWTSSAAPAIQELLDSRGTLNTSQWDDEESRAVEALKIALQQGLHDPANGPADPPETRGYSVGHNRHCRFFGQVYTDVIMTRARWHFDGDLAGVERILIGRPLWVRTNNPAATVDYATLRARSSRRRH